jgi:hypothetical protein
MPGERHVRIIPAAPHTLLLGLPALKRIRAMLKVPVRGVPKHRQDCARLEDSPQRSLTVDASVRAAACGGRGGQRSAALVREVRAA